jgi:hypothetical protein
MASAARRSSRVGAETSPHLAQPCRPRWTSLRTIADREGRRRMRAGAAQPAQVVHLLIAAAGQGTPSANNSHGYYPRNVTRASEGDVGNPGARNNKGGTMRSIAALVTIIFAFVVFANGPGFAGASQIIAARSATARPSFLEAEGSPSTPARECTGWRAAPRAATSVEPPARPCSYRAAGPINPKG